ncbi:hypothetical protein MGYG_07676 [Nannizzia gypsea CBS 118893]|uniref:DUF4604 domain-containing protein n=1 Tax=Arthroderma gypseum (strain ATCC MYA-4604 / CBS 118893) TaxID=535722 RepID=E4V3U6_ARTGP|nr:hypothetical protein MGYG_07676 [Nannizzia gypsea CBS 118893]EFR04670.1 hypothetical protein MGYG_07676 [Nannizzia gypsea CBS 118893]
MSRRANNLSYEKPEPSFLRKLRNQYGDGGEHHRSRPSPRPTKSKYAEDEDDGPTYVDEDSNEVISKEKYLEMVAGPKGDTEENEAGENGQPTKATAGEGAEPEAETRASKSKQNVAEIGASKKRKQGKVVGGGDVPEDQERSQAQTEAPKRKKNTKKKIKLSFDDEE